MKNNIRILMLEDEARDAELANRALRESDISFSLKRVETRDEFIFELQQNPPDLIVSDHALPDFDGSTALSIARVKSPDIPFIFFTGSLGEENILDMLKRGATDYVLKHRLTDLAPAVRRALREREERIRRKQAEAALRKSEEQLRLLIENVKDYAIFMLDDQGRITTWNSGADRLHGYQAEEVIGKPFSIFFATRDEAGEIPSRLLETAANTGCAHHDGWCVRKDGTRFRANWSLSTVYDAAGKLTGYSNVTQDITERAKTEEALQKSEERYRQLVELSPCAVLVHSAGRLVFANSTAIHMLGVADLQQVIGRLISDFVHPDFRDVVKQRQATLNQGGPVPSIEEKWIRLDGKAIDVLVAATSLALENQAEQTSIQVIALDITEQKRGEAALQKSEERLRLALESVEDYAIYMLDAQGRVTSWNTGAERMTGFQSGEVLGQPVNHCRPTGDAQPANDTRELERAGKEGRVQDEGWCLRKDGSRYYAQWTVTAVPDVDGQINGFLKVARDVTAKRQHEEQVARWNLELEHRVAERTAQLEAANKELEAFSYSVSHDLRAPLRHIDGFVDILQTSASDKLDADNRQHLQTIADAAKQMGKLIDDLLAFSRMSRVKLNIKPTSLENLVQETIHSLQGDMKGRQIEWVIGGLPTVEVDPDLMRQVVVNLISNAVKYTRKSEAARVEIGSTTQDDEIVIFFRDNGVGFDMRYADKLFGVFQRLHRSSEFEGTGVGLANVRRIVHRHGGRSWAEGVVNQGATFYFSLPNSTKSPSAA